MTLINQIKDLINRVENGDMEAENARNFTGEEGKWVTIKGTHIFIPEGKDVDEVVKEKFGNKEEKETSKETCQDIIDKYDKKYNVDKNDLGQSWYDKASINEIKTDIKTFEHEVEKNTEYLERIKELPEDKPFFKANGGKKEVIKGIEEQIKYDKEQIEYAKAHLEKKQAKPQPEGKKDSSLPNNITESKDEHGRTVISYKGTNKKVKIHKNGDYFLASFGQELKDDDGYMEFQVFPSASGKSFKTEKGAKKWAIDQLKKHIENSLADTFCEALAEIIIEQ